MLSLVRLPSLDLIKGFVAVGRRMSITQAADDLCLSQSAVSKQIRALEDALGVPLFHRGFRSLELTEFGHLLFSVANESVLQLQEAVALMGPPKRRPVTITASTGVASLWLLPRISKFQALHPSIDVRLHASNTVLELGPDFDLAMRYCPIHQAPKGSMRLFGETIAPVTSPKSAFRSLETENVLQKTTLLEFDINGRPWLHWSSWLAARGWRIATVRSFMHFNQYEQLVQASVDGLGIILGRLELLQDHLLDRRLEVVHGIGRPEITEFSYCLVPTQSNLSGNAKIFMDWLAASAQIPPVIAASY